MLVLSFPGTENCLLFTFPNKFSFSLRYLDANTADTSTLRAPSGVTSDAGANAYATKFAASPIPTATFVLNVNFT